MKQKPRYFCSRCSHDGNGLMFLCPKHPSVEAVRKAIRRFKRSRR